MGENEQHAKERLRRRLGAARARVSADTIIAASAAVCTRALELPAFRAAQHVVAYAPVGNEVDPSALVAAALAAGRAVYYPRVRGHELEFVRPSSSTLVSGEWGIPEPAPEEMEILSPVNEDVCFLVPGLAFDRRGARLGRGLGCYDRGLARHPTAARIGLAYDLQLVPAIPLDVWDVAMHAVVTETDVYVVGHPDGSPALKENRP